MPDELELLVEAGLSRFDALSTATRNAGEFIGTLVGPGVRVGRISTGSLADLLVESNPLEGFATLRRPLRVMARGTWLPKTELERSF